MEASRSIERLPIDRNKMRLIKLSPYGMVQKYKVRLMTKGFNQKHSIDKFETYAPIARFEMMRTIIALTS